MKNNRKNKKKNSLKKWLYGIVASLTASGISIGGYGAYKFFTVEEKQLGEKITDLDQIQNIDTVKEEQTLEDEIKDCIDENISFDFGENDTEDLEESHQEIEEEATESLDASKDKKTTIASYSLNDLVIPIIKNFETVSVVDALNEVGYDSSLESRARLAVYFNIVTNPDDFEGLGYQNLQLLEALRQYAREFQNSTSNDYINVADNSTSGNDNIENNDNGYSNENKDSNHNNQDKDNEDDKDKKGDHKWSKWLALNDEQEYRKCSKHGEKQYQNHPLYGDWIDNGDDTKSRTCDNCNHTMTVDYVWGEWLAVDDEKEYRIREDGKREEQVHPSYGDWIDNGDDTKSRTCDNCGHTMTIDKEPEHQHHPEKQKPVSLNKTDEEHCMVVDYVCPEDGFIDETLREYIPHNLSETPIVVEGDQGLFQCDRCELYVTKTIEQEKPEHTHHPEATKPVSLNKIDEEHCMVVDYVCPEDGFIDETLREYIPHNLSETPIVVEGDQGLFQCDRCELYVTKTISNNKDEETVSTEENKEEPDENLVINFDFDISLKNEYDYLDEEEPDVSLELPAVQEIDELKVVDEKENLEANFTYLLEDKGAPLMLEAKQNNIQDILASFDTELYKRLFKEKVALEQSLATNKGIEREEKLKLLRDIDNTKASMVQDLANALVKEEIKSMKKEKGQELVFKI